MTLSSGRIPVAFATLLLLAVAGTAPAETPPGRAALINACIHDIRSGLKTGHAMTNSQRMMAEEQCRAYAESQLQQAPVEKPASAGNAKVHRQHPDRPATEYRDSHP